MKKKKYIVLSASSITLIAIYFLFLAKPSYRLGEFDEIKWDKVQSIVFKCTIDGKDIGKHSYFLDETLFFLRPILQRGIFAERPKKWPTLRRIFYEGYYKDGKDHIISKMDYYRLIRDFKESNRLPLGSSSNHTRVICFEYSDSRAICIPYHTDEKGFYGADFESERVFNVLKKIDKTKTILEDTTYFNQQMQIGQFPLIKIPSLYDEDANNESQKSEANSSPSEKIH
jgi:hypothetical protein